MKYQTGDRVTVSRGPDQGRVGTVTEMAKVGATLIVSVELDGGREVRFMEPIVERGEASPVMVTEKGS